MGYLCSSDLSHDCCSRLCAFLPNANFAHRLLLTKHHLLHVCDFVRGWRVSLSVPTVIRHPANVLTYIVSAVLFQFYSYFGPVQSTHRSHLVASLHYRSRTTPPSWPINTTRSASIRPSSATCAARSTTSRRTATAASSHRSSIRSARATSPTPPCGSRTPSSRAPTSCWRRTSGRAPLPASPTPSTWTRRTPRSGDTASRCCSRSCSLPST